MYSFFFFPLPVIKSMECPQTMITSHVKKYSCEALQHFLKFTVKLQNHRTALLNDLLESTLEAQWVGFKIL